MEQKEINASLLHHINTAMRRIEYLEQRLAATEQRLIDYDRALELPHNAGEIAQARRRIALNQKARVIRDDPKRITSFWCATSPPTSCTTTASSRSPKCRG